MPKRTVHFVVLYFWLEYFRQQKWGDIKLDWMEVGRYISISWSYACKEMNIAAGKERLSRMLLYFLFFLSPFILLSCIPPILLTEHTFLKKKQTPSLDNYMFGFSSWKTLHKPSPTGFANPTHYSVCNSAYKVLAPETVLLI